MKKEAPFSEQLAAARLSLYLRLPLFALFQSLLNIGEDTSASLSVLAIMTRHFSQRLGKRQPRDCGRLPFLLETCCAS